MLSYFPTPYPHEWWWSVLCRYHLQSGHERCQPTIYELFGKRPTASIGTIFPNSALIAVAKHLPSCFEIRSLIVLISLDATPSLRKKNCWQDFARGILLKLQAHVT